MPRTADRQDRISLRLSPHSKRKLQRAATYSDKTLSDFVLDCALRQADEVVRKQEVVTLKPEDWDRFVEALMNPPKPNRKLKEALAWHAKVIRK